MPTRSLLVRAVVTAVALSATPASRAAGAPTGIRTPRAEVRPPRAAAEIRIEPAVAATKVGNRVEILVAILADDGLPVDAPDATLDADFGELTPVQRVDVGILRASLSIPNTLPSTRAILLGARAGHATAERSLPIEPGPATTLSISAPASNPADGASRVQLWVRLEDAFDNPADDEPRARTGEGALPTKRLRPGLWSVEYVPDRLERDAEQVVFVEAGPLKGSYALQLRATRRWASFAVWGGAALGPEGNGPAAGVSASAWWRRGGGSQLGLVLDTGWWSLRSSTSVAVPLGSSGFTTTASYVPLTAAAALSHPIGRRIVLTATGGGGAAIVSISQTLSGQPSVSELGLSPAALGSASAGLRTGPGIAFLELRGVWIADAGLETVSGTTRSVLLLAGYRFDAL